jgi:hypothetical protein
MNLFLPPCGRDRREKALKAKELKHLSGLWHLGAALVSK